MKINSALGRRWYLMSIMKRRTNSRETATASLLKDWSYLREPRQSYKERAGLGKEMRAHCSRRSNGQWKPPGHRVDPLKLLASQDDARSAHLIPLRYGRMAQSPFAFFRGAALIMASDLSEMPRTKSPVQLCGDCHLSNFGVFATPERNVIFDLNDFDETLPGPFEWDLKRLAASFAIACADNGLSDATVERSVYALAKTYRQKMQEFSRIRSLDVWYERINLDYLIKRLKSKHKTSTMIRMLEKRSHAGALAKLTEVVDGKRRIKDVPPLIYHSGLADVDSSREVFIHYVQSLWPSRQRLLQRYHLVDVAAKVVGIGSVGTAAGIALFQGEGEVDDYVFLQVKEASRSVLERYLGKSQFAHNGERIVNGQRLIQAAFDLFLGWGSGPKRQFYFRQLMDMKGSVAVSELDAEGIEDYAEVCAHVLARAHARTGDPALLYGYLGNSDTFDEALTKFAFAYRKQNDRDYDALIKAVKAGKIRTTPGV